MLREGFREKSGRKEDSDLDELPPDKIGEMLRSEEPSRSQIKESPTPFQGPRSFFHSSSSSTSVVRLPDGSVEKTTSVRNGDGSEETRVCKTDRCGNTCCRTRTRARDGTVTEREEQSTGAPSIQQDDSHDMLSKERITTQSLFDKFFK